MILFHYIFINLYICMYIDFILKDISTIFIATANFLKIMYYMLIGNTFFVG